MPLSCLQDMKKAKPALHTQSLQRASESTASNVECQQTCCLAGMQNLVELTQETAQHAAALVFYCKQY